MMNFIKNFRKDENGAVTVDWVVLTAAVVGLAVAAYSGIQTQTATLAGTIDDVVGAESTNHAGDITALSTTASGS
ncbi:hypothetical protein Q4544_03560 [Cognatishimia sp. 1_MG-2023]|uniref:hypothetical protein n=1 Tax=Cognatishimia sp. 1_MG-2023 TaxID=3062642 RepID=UPI0026E3144F|nr:hypothetical protein [Cognatishimia sp. 1_MG-2023]MDO6726001.1 hypothetical protein [Cognatishimia sp. 1_MG-2023]